MKHLVILYDTDCGFCDWTRDIIEKYDRDKLFEFESISSKKAKKLALRYSQTINLENPESFNAS